MEKDDEVRKLKEKVRALEFQLSSLSEGLSSSEAVNSEVDLEVLRVETLVDLSNSKLWLERSSREKDNGCTAEDLIDALRRHTQRELCNAEQERRSIDSRTFTRPKKRMGRPSLELFESQTRLPWTGELLSDMTCSLLDSSIIASSSTTITESSPDNETQSSVSFVNKKQRVMPLSHVNKLPSDALYDLDNCVNNTICSSSKYENNLRSSEIEAMEISSPDVEATDTSLGIMDSHLLEAGLMDSVNFNLKPPENNSKVSQYSLNSKPTAPSPDSYATYVKTISETSNFSCEDEYLNHMCQIDKLKPCIRKPLNTTFTPPTTDIEKPLLDKMKSVSRKPLSTTFTPPTSEIETPLLDKMKSFSRPPLNTTFTPPTNDIETPVLDKMKSFSKKSLNTTYTSTDINEKPFLNTTFTPKTNDTIQNPPLNTTFTPPNPERFPKPQFNTTTSFSSDAIGVKPGNATPSHPTNSCSVKLNTTFSPPSNGMAAQRIIPPPALSELGFPDDDTSTTRLMSVGDVQNIARLQEESLVASTPKHTAFTKVFDAESSPVLSRPGSESEIHTIGIGYGSDQSHSSRSPLSSLHSSPASSPFGSSTALPTSQPRHHTDLKNALRPNGNLQRRDTYSMIPSVKSKVSGMLPPAASVAAPGRPSVQSGLRPPMVHGRVSGVAPVAVSRLSRPTGTGIPRPAQVPRTGIPKIRPPSSQTRKKEWTDECY